MNKRARGIAAARVRWAIARQRGYHRAAAYRIWWQRGWWVAAPGADGYLAGDTAALAAATVSEVEEAAA
jgi:hypothetical protein